MRYFIRVVPRNSTLFCKEDKDAHNPSIALSLPNAFDFGDLDIDFDFGFDLGQLLSMLTGIHQISNNMYH